MKADDLVDANVIATHAYQVLLAEKAGKKFDEYCWGGSGLGAGELQALVDHQKALLATPAEELQLWAGGARTPFEPRRDLKPILESRLRPSAATLPVNVLVAWLNEKRQTRARGSAPAGEGEYSGKTQVKALAGLLQMMLEIERDGERLQDMFRLYHALGLPVHVGQIGIAAASDEEYLQFGKELAPRMCPSPFQADPPTLQMLFRKMYIWGRRHTGERDKAVLAKELLAEKDVAALVPLIRKMRAEKIAVIGHSYTMEVNWSSPAPFVPVVSEIFKSLNPGLEVRQWGAGGLTYSGAYSRYKFHEAVLAWRPQRVLLVLATAAKEDDEALDKMSAAFNRLGVKAMLFDRLAPAQANFPWDPQKKAGRGAANVIEVSKLLNESPDTGKFLSLDGIHMTEPYHRLMAKEWLKYLLGVRGEKLGAE